MFTYTECRDCEFCQKETPHEIKRVERVKNVKLPIVKNTCMCLQCGAIYSEKRMIVPKG